jgi:predicted kinase
MKIIDVPTICVLQGLPASGKSFLAKILTQDRNSKRVSKDDLRSMLHSGTYTPELEEFILEVRDTIIETSILRGYNVVVDDTNLNPAHITSLKILAEHLNVGIFIIVMETPLEECIRRDSLRDWPVGEAVIRDMYNKYLKKD